MVRTPPMWRQVNASVAAVPWEVKHVRIPRAPKLPRDLIAHLPSTIREAVGG